MAWLPQLIASRLIQGILWLVITIPVALFGFAERLLRFVLSPDFINVSYTTNDFVNLGWTLTRDFANIFFIIFLVIIGLATALRIREYQWQKTLPLLIGIALLINFTPVILGLIIDASNIIMNFFVSGIAKESLFWPRMQAHLDSVVKIVGAADWGDPGSYFAILTMPLVYFIFNLTAAIIYFLFVILFVLRYIALWTLVILSPIAFLCYILPATRGIFSLWWNQFLQWCIIGVAAAFMLYLGDHLLYFTMGGLLVAEVDQEGWGLANAVIPYCIVLGFLLFGFFGALSTSAMGATAVISAAQKGVKTAGKWTATKGARIAGQKARGFPGVSRIEERIRRGLERMPAIGRPFFGGPGAFEAGQRARIDVAAKRLERNPNTPTGNQAILNRVSKLSWPPREEEQDERVAGIEVLSKRKELKLTDKQTQKFLPEFQRFGGNIKAVSLARPDLVTNFTTIDPTTKKRRKMTIEETMAKIEPGEFWRNVQKEALANSDVVFHAALDERKFVEMTRHLKPELKKEFKKTFLALSPRPLTSQQKTIIRKRTKDLYKPEWKV